MSTKANISPGQAGASASSVRPSSSDAARFELPFDLSRHERRPALWPSSLIKLRWRERNNEYRGVSLPPLHPRIGLVWNPWVVAEPGTRHVTIWRKRVPALIITTTEAKSRRPAANELVIQSRLSSRHGFSSAKPSTGIKTRERSAGEPGGGGERTGAR